MTFTTDEARALTELQAALKASESREAELHRDLAGTVRSLDNERGMRAALERQNAMLRAEIDDLVNARNAKRWDAIRAFRNRHQRKG